MAGAASPARGDFAAAQKESKDLTGSVTLRLGGHHWQAIDARITAARAERLGRLDLAQRRRLSEVDRLWGAGT